MRARTPTAAGLLAAAALAVTACSSAGPAATFTPGGGGPSAAGGPATDVTTESFTGTVRYFDMSVIPDPLVKGDLDVSACFDNAGSSNTDLTTGKVIPDTSSPDTHYVRIADELRKDSAGQWQVVSSLPAIYYPQAAQCKP